MFTKLKSRDLIIPFLVMWLALAFPTAPQAQTAKPVGELKRAVIPMDHSGDHLQIEVMIGGQGPFLFQLDTYASIDACVDDDFAKAMGFPKTGTTLNSDGNTTRTRDLVRIDNLQFGSVRFSGLTTLVDDYDWVAAGGRKIKGLLGLPLFRDLLLTIDYPASQIVLERGELGAKTAHCLPLKLDSGGPDITLSLGGKPTTFGIDTGMGISMLLPMDDAKALGLADKLELIGSGQTVYSRFDLFKGQLQQDMQVAGFQVPKPDVYFREGNFKRLVGKGLLKSFALTFDQKLKKVRIVTPKQDKDKTQR